MSDSVASLIRCRRVSGIPWARNTTALSKSKVALVTTAGFFIKGQPPFNEANVLGDFGFRTIHRDIALSKLTLAKYMVDRRLALLDPNMLFPISRLMELQRQGFIKEVAANHFSFYGYVFNLNRIMDGSAKDVARRLRYEGVDKVLVMTTSILSQEIALLVQRSIEEEGIPTVSLVYTEDAIAALKPPRTCLLAKGSLCRLEEYLDEDVQMNLVKFMLNQFDSAKNPGTVKKLVIKTPLSKRPKQSDAEKARRGIIQKDFFQ